MQLDPESCGTQGGLGVGLALVRRIVELHAGRVVARSEGFNHGSEFPVQLPLLAAAVATPARGVRLTGESTADARARGR